MLARMPLLCSADVLSAPLGARSRQTGASMEEEARKLLDKLRSLHEQKVRAFVPTELPTPSGVLDLESRGGDTVRIFKHIHQMCMLQVRNFREATGVKTLFITDMYLMSEKSSNPIGVVHAARAALELRGLVFGVRRRLTARLKEADHVKRGTEFFQAISRGYSGARLSSLSPVLPFNATGVVDELSERDAESGWAKEHYDWLCEQVHHNWGSNIRAANALHTRPVAEAREGAIYISTPNPSVARYEFPASASTGDAVGRTVGRMIESVEATFRDLPSIPESPYSSQELLELTGSSTGAGRLPPPSVQVRTARVGRNIACPCGSGKKYKRCHGAN